MEDMLRIPEAGEAPGGVTTVTVPGAAPVLRAKRALAITAAFFGIQFILSVAFAIAIAIYVIASKGLGDPSALADALKVTVLPMTLAGELAGAWVVFRLTRRSLKGPLKDGALAPIGWRPALAVEMSVAALAGCALALAYLFLMTRVFPPDSGRHLGPLATAAMGAGWPRHLWAFLALALAPPIEEFLFRGVLLEGLANSFGIAAAAAIVTGVFVVTHAFETLNYWPAWAILSLLALLALHFRLRTRSLAPAICAHAGYNLVMVITVYSGGA